MTRYSETAATRSQFFDEQSYADVTLICGEKEFKCSSLILGENSSVFQTMFKHSGFKEAKTNSATINGIEVTTLEKVIRFLYSGSIDLEPSNILEVLNFANQYDITPLRDACGDYLFENVTPESVMSPLWTTAKIFQAEKLGRNCLNYSLENFTLSNFKQLHETQGFLECGDDLIVELLLHPDIKIFNERDVMMAIFDWMMFDQQNRVTKAFKMLDECLRKDFIDLEDIQAAYRRYTEEFDDVTHAALSQFMSSLASPLFVSPFLKPRTKSSYSERLAAVISETNNYNRSTYLISFPCDTVSMGKGKLKCRSSDIDTRHNNSLISSTSIRQNLFLKTISNSQSNATIKKISYKRNEFKEEEEQTIQLKTSPEKLILISDSILLALAIDEKGTLSIETQRKGLLTEWTTEKFHTIPNAPIAKSNLKNCVCFRRYVIIFDPEKQKAHVFDFQDPGKLRLVNLHFDQTDTDVPRVATQKHNLVVFMSESKIFLVDLTTDRHFLLEQTRILSQ